MGVDRDGGGQRIFTSYLMSFTLFEGFYLLSTGLDPTFEISLLCPRRLP